MIAITTYATKGYLYAWPQMLRRVTAAAAHHREAHFIFSTDRSEDARRAASQAEAELPPDWKIHVVTHEIEDDSSEAYKEAAQMRIAMLQGSAFALARRLRCTAAWSVESDILVPPDALRMCEWALAMPGGYYDVAMVTYPNRAFLGGRGDWACPIAEDFLPHERELPEQLRRRLAAHRAWAERRGSDRVEAAPSSPRRWLARWHRINERLHAAARKAPPAGNVFAANAAHGWRPRGWLENAYPAIGRGALLPTDWVGLGCTLLSARSLGLATFEGYHGQGTQDLFLCRHRWRPEGLRMAVIPHTLCDHIKPACGENRQRTGEIEHHRAYHEPAGPCEGHLRVHTAPWRQV